MGVPRDRKATSRSYGGIYIALFFTASILLPNIALGNETSVINTFSASSNTGGNSASNGAVVEGKSKSSVKVYTEVDGEVITDINEETTDGGIIIDEEIGSEEGAAHIQTHIEVQAGSDGSAEASQTTTDEREAKEAVVEANDEAEEGELTATTSAGGASTQDASENTITNTVRTWVRNMITYVLGFFT